MTKEKETFKHKIKKGCDSLSYRLNAVSLNRRKLYVVLIFLVGFVILLLNIFIPRAIRSSNKNEPNNYSAQTDTVSSINSTTTPDVDDFRFGF